MSGAVQAALQSWSLPIPVTIFLVLAASVYLRGWLHLRSAFPNRMTVSRLAAFVGGVCTIWIAVGSPLAEFDEELLTVHMVQHLLLMVAAPPLILFAAPALPLLHGLSPGLVRATLGPILRWPVLQWLGRTLTHPVCGWLAATAAVLGWHFPPAFELALRSDWWHEVEHASFFAAGLLFWWPVVTPWPSVARWPRWSVPLYLFFATLPCDALSAFLAFCDRVVYPSYLSRRLPFDISPLRDQACAGALMWVCVTFAYLVPAVVVTIQLLSPPNTEPPDQDRDTVLSALKV